MATKTHKEEIDFLKVMVKPWDESQMRGLKQCVCKALNTETASGFMCLMYLCIPMWEFLLSLSSINFGLISLRKKEVNNMGSLCTWSLNRTRKSYKQIHFRRRIGKQENIIYELYPYFFSTPRTDFHQTPNRGKGIQRKSSSILPNKTGNRGWRNQSISASPSEPESISITCRSQLQGFSLRPHIPTEGAESLQLVECRVSQPQVALHLFTSVFVVWVGYVFLSHPSLWDSQGTKACVQTV